MSRCSHVWRLSSPRCSRVARDVSRVARAVLRVSRVAHARRALSVRVIKLRRL
jgi:hypothetical protein